MNPIREWLNGSRSYLLGVALYKMHGQDSRLLDMFAQGASSYRQKRLEDALRSLISVADRADTVPEGPKHVVAAVAAAVMPETAVAEAKDTYRAEWLPHYMEMNSLRHKLIHAPDDKTRGEWAHRILLLERQCIDIWQRRDYHLRTGEPMPEAKAPDAIVITDRNELHRQLTNYRTYVAKAEKGKTFPPAWKLANWRDQIVILEKQLKNE